MLIYHMLYLFMLSSSTSVYLYEISKKGKAMEKIEQGKGISGCLLKLIWSALLSWHLTEA